MFIVTDDILERLTCSHCKKYLSVKNIKVYPNRGVKCGRCSSTEDAGVVSLFGVLAEEALFRCVNRFEGCNKLLSYSEVAKHEKTCIGKEYDCPCCTLSFKGTAYEIYVHFKEKHAHLILLNTPKIVLEIDNELAETYLYRQNDLLFFVNARYNKGEEELTLYVTYLGNDQDASSISQMFTLHSLDSKLKHTTKRKSCSSVKGWHLKSFAINISTADFPKNVIVCKFHLDTENVENLIAFPENFKKSKQDVEDMETSIDVKPLMFGPGMYPVETMNSAATNGSFWDFTPASTTTTASTTSFRPIVSSNFINRENTTTSSSFGQPTLSNPMNQPFFTSCTPTTTIASTTSFKPSFGQSIFANPQSTDASSPFGKLVTSSNPVNQPFGTSCTSTTTIASTASFEPIFFKSISANQQSTTTSPSTFGKPVTSSKPVNQPFGTSCTPTTAIASTTPFKPIFFKSISENQQSTTTSPSPFGKPVTSSKSQNQPFGTSMSTTTIASTTSFKPNFGNSSSENQRNTTTSPSPFGKPVTSSKPQNQPFGTNTRPPSGFPTSQTLNWFTPRTTNN